MTSMIDLMCEKSLYWWCIWTKSHFEHDVCVKQYYMHSRNKPKHCIPKVSNSSIRIN